MKYIFDEYYVSILFDNENHCIEFLTLLSKMYSEIFQTITNTPFLHPTRSIMDRMIVYQCLIMIINMLI